MAAVVVALALAGCGGNDDDDATPAPGDTNASSSSTSSTTTAPAQAAEGGVTRGPATQSGPSTATGGDFKAQPGPTGTDPNAAKPKHPLKVSLGSPCIRAGEKQTITIETVSPSAVGYDSYYGDGKSGISEGFYGGNNGKSLENENVWTDTWVVNPAAPPGTVRVIVQGISVRTSANQLEVFFDLKRPTENC
ncbi:MAG TPA: hypothetical protein VM938_04710 [Acidimicrobiales bacterium]|nr:hypothetical protein [Acidimicrobiales bacterium]